MDFRTDGRFAFNWFFGIKNPQNMDSGYTMCKGKFFLNLATGFILFFVFRAWQQFFLAENPVFFRAAVHNILYITYFSPYIHTYTLTHPPTLVLISVRLYVKHASMNARDEGFEFSGSRIFRVWERSEPLTQWNQMDNENWAYNFIKITTQWQHFTEKWTHVLYSKLRFGCSLKKKKPHKIEQNRNSASSWLPEWNKITGGFDSSLPLI